MFAGDILQQNVLHMVHFQSMPAVYDLNFANDAQAFTSSKENTEHKVTVPGYDHGVRRLWPYLRANILFEIIKQRVNSLNDSLTYLQDTLKTGIF